jgi:hypothetical protein
MWSAAFKCTVQNSAGKEMADSFYKGMARGAFSTPAVSVLWCLPSGSAVRDQLFSRHAAEGEFSFESASGDSMSVRSRSSVSVAALAAVDSLELFHALKTYSRIIYLLRSPQEHASFVAFYAAFELLSLRFRACSVSVLFTRWTEHVTATVAESRLVMSNGVEWQSVDWFQPKLMEAMSLALMLANREAQTRADAAASANHRQRSLNGKRGSQQGDDTDLPPRKHWQGGDRGDQRGGDRRGDQRGDQRDSRGGNGGRPGSGRGGHGGDGRNGGRAGDGTEAAGASAAKVGAAAAAAGAGAGAAERGKPEWCKWGPTCTLRDSGCRFKHG